MDHSQPYSDAYLRGILERVKVIAVVGASPHWNRPSYFASKYLQGKGYRMIPVNPRAAGEVILGETCHPALESVPEAVDMVDVFRRSEEAPDLARAAIAKGASVLWLQLGVFSKEAAALAEGAGLAVVMNRCPKIEYARLFGEIGRHGISSNVFSSRRRTVAPAKRLI